MSNARQERERRIATLRTVHIYTTMREIARIVHLNSEESRDIEEEVAWLADKFIEDILDVE